MYDIGFHSLFISSHPMAMKEVMLQSHFWIRKTDVKVNRMPKSDHSQVSELGVWSVGYTTAT